MQRSSQKNFLPWTDLGQISNFYIKKKYLPQKSADFAQFLFEMGTLKPLLVMRSHGEPLSTPVKVVTALIV